MKITRSKPEFKPITIVIETEEEAEALFHMADMFSNYQRVPNEDAKNMALKISNWFTNNGI